MTIMNEGLLRRVRERLLIRRLVSEDELARVERFAGEKKVPLDDLLVSTGLLTEDQIVAVLSEELSVPYVFPHASAIDPALMTLFQPALLKGLRAVPMYVEDGQIIVATSDPTTLGSIQDLEAACGGHVRLALAPRRHVERALARLFPGEMGKGERPGRAGDTTALGLFYGHIAGAVAERAQEVRFEPVDGAILIRYKVGGALTDRGREPLVLHSALVSRARILLGTCRGERPHESLGNLSTRLAGFDLVLTIGIVPTRAGETVIVKFTAGEPRSEMSAVPPKAEASPGPAASGGGLDIASLLLFTKEMGGSDLHLSSGAVPMVRVHGEMRKLTQSDGREAPPCQAEEIRGMVLDVLSDAQKAKLEADKELDFAMSIGKGTRFRGNAFFQDRGLAAVFRVIPTVIKTCEELGLPPAIKALAELEKGLVLCTGPTGSGKSTTLAALIDHINSSRRGHILTVEDPIEFVHAPKSCMINQRELGRNTKSFANALKSALREDPDVILVGEMRDLETIALAITAAETGHLVFGTLHTSSAAKTVDRIINVFPAGEQAQIRAMLAESLQAVVAQVLLPKKGGKGRVAAQEILLASTGVKAMIREGKTFQIPSAIQTGAKYGMQSLEQCLTRLSVNGLVEAAEVERTLAALGLTREETADAALLRGGGVAPAGGAPPTRPTTVVGRNTTIRTV